MLNIPVLRWGRPYTSLEVDNVIHFSTGETLAQVSQANPGLLAKDIRQAQRARDVLCEIPIRDLIGRMKKARDNCLAHLDPLSADVNDLLAKTVLKPFPEL